MRSAWARRVVVMVAAATGGCVSVADAGGVAVDLGRRAPSAVGKVEGCTRGACVAGPPSGTSGLWAPFDDLGQGATVDVEMTVDGRSVLVTAAPLTTVQTSGQQCEPAPHQAHVVLPQEVRCRLRHP